MGLLSKCNIRNIPKISDGRGNLSFVEEMNHVPFDVKRIYYLYDVPSEQHRGGHAHKDLEQFIIAISGSFDIVLDDGFEKVKINLYRPDQGLYVPRMIWRDLVNFSDNAVCLVLASQLYSETDYFRDYDEFTRKIRSVS